MQKNSIKYFSIEDLREAFKAGVMAGKGLRPDDFEDYLEDCKYEKKYLKVLRGGFIDFVVKDLKLNKQKVK